MKFRQKVEDLVSGHENKIQDIDRSNLIKHVVDKRFALVSESGALAAWTPPESTGRSPADTYIVQNPKTEEKIDWSSPNNKPMDPNTFTMLVEDAIETLDKKTDLYVTNRVVGADTKYALPVQTITDNPLTVLFTDNMFRPTPSNLGESVFAETPFTLLAAPHDKLDSKKYEGRLRNLDSGEASNMAVAMDFDNMVGVVYGSAYMGSCKKLIFTVMNYILPDAGVLPLHCAANEGGEGDVAVFLGLSGTGKTSFSSDPHRAMLGDDEHGWSENGVANFEYGCYAKMINVTHEKEPEIYDAVMTKKTFEEHGAIVENAMIYPDGRFDFHDKRFTENSRASYPISSLKNIKPSAVGAHPKTIIFLTADANGVIPPISRLNKQQAMLWFLLGYTSKLAGTETGIKDPVSTFSRFFGQPFMPRQPQVYADMLGEKLDEYDSNVFLVNSGWVSGPYGVGHRIDIKLNWNMIHAALDGGLDDVEYEQDDLFHVSVPRTCPGLEDPKWLDARRLWSNPQEYDVRAKKLAKEFSDYFDEAYADKKIDSEIVRQCPGK
ncbi:MAG: phosphoenolpyruvate carboxykinase (ATP) [Candidatus Altiarchaeales archaeon]|nr:phosphoenolpyruvate carboxykinase (ATP) [Candidatus Altiarchaeales archaeon]